MGGIISIHGHGKTSNYESIKSYLSVKQEVKSDIVRNVDLIEVGKESDTTIYLEKIFPHLGYKLPLIVASDDHCKVAYNTSKCCWIKADPTFSGLTMALREPQHRFYLGIEPPSETRLKANKTKFIHSITFERQATMPTNEHWLSGELPLNPGLVGIIGNKGSGKSALADSLGLLGNYSNEGSFSFLSKQRFRHPKSGRASHIKAKLSWHDGSNEERLLSDSTSADESERIKYLPQSFVERVCNDLAEADGGSFEQELKNVVFSKVSHADRLGKNSLDELIEYKTQELQREAKSLAGSLRPIADRLASLEEKLEPGVRSAVLKKIERLRQEINSHKMTRPVEVFEPPANATDAPHAASQLKSLQELEKKREAIQTQAEEAEQNFAAQKIQHGDAEKLIAKLNNLKTEFDRRYVEISEDAVSLGLDPKGLVVLTVDYTLVNTVRDNAAAQLDAENALLDGEGPAGLRRHLIVIQAAIKAEQTKFDKPNQVYQAYLEKLANWKAKRIDYLGSTNDPESLLGLRAQLHELEKVPTKIRNAIEGLKQIAAQVHTLRMKELELYSQFYKPVQHFVDQHPLAKEQLQIEFRVELLQSGFVENLISQINQQRVGSFYGVDEGRSIAQSICEGVDWTRWVEIEKFISLILDYLHQDKREGRGQNMSVANQMRKGKSVAELYEWLYGLSFLECRYVLKSEGKRIEQLSPGERGTLLLIFYLLVDDSDVPLIIDQPEANLDNATVAKRLVDCIRDAASRRQVIIVTHNPNLAVVCDAEQIIHAHLDLEDGHRVTYTCGALENPAINEHTINVLEGGRVPFDKRDDTYMICEQ